MASVATSIAPMSSRGMSRTKLTMTSTVRGTAAALMVSSTPLVRHAHRRQDLGQRDRRDLVGPLVAVPQDLAHVARVPRVLCPPRPDRGEQVVDRGGEQLLQRGRPAPADLGRDLVRIAVQTQ